mmetsp:Transcript_32766/g.38583  ORF Transcript_32766/g.38583 Transcript_32766/m.38583 type:complete len:87 (+) Transcript_32766:1-261(+)
MQAFGFTGEDYKPVQKPEPTKTKGGFHAFGKNSKSAIAAVSKHDLDSKNKKLAEFRKLIGREEGREATNLTLNNEKAIDVALKRAH